MDKKIIENIFDKILVRINIKCFYDYEYVKEAFKKCAEKYNLKLIESKDKKVAYSLVDEKHQVTLNFTKRFITTKVLGFRDEDNKLFDLDNVFQVYDNFPNNIKHTLNLVTYDEGIEDNKNQGIYGESDFLEIR